MFFCCIVDPWDYRTKRETMTELEHVAYELEKVVLLDTIGNAGLEASFHYIVSHINDTNSQWIKRAGVHALRRYQDDLVHTIT